VSGWSSWGSGLLVVDVGVEDQGSEELAGDGVVNRRACQPRQASYQRRELVRMRRTLTITGLGAAIVVLFPGWAVPRLGLPSRSGDAARPSRRLCVMTWLPPAAFATLDRRSWLVARPSPMTCDSCRETTLAGDQWHPG
jgi:hypothetical protein